MIFNINYIHLFKNIDYIHSLLNKSKILNFTYNRDQGCISLCNVVMTHCRNIEQSRC